MVKITGMVGKIHVPGVYTYYPEMGQKKLECELEARMSYDGKHYRIVTPLSLRGQGIKFEKTYRAQDLTPYAMDYIGWNVYQVTEKAYDKLKKKYSISVEALLS